MSADSPRRQSHGIAVPAIVPPQVVSDRSILDSAIGFISDVTLVTHQSHTEPKDTIIWARFETTADISDPCFGADWEMEGHVAPPLLLVLGYGLGVQVWAIPANGEAIEVLSWRHGVVSTLRVLPTPGPTRFTDEHGRADETMDAFAEKRPLIALVDSGTASTQPQFCTLNFVSLKTGKQVKTIKFKNPILDVLANRSSLVAVFHERLAVFDAGTLEDRLSITTCYPSPGINPNPVALGQRWLAYAEQKLIPSKRSGGGWDGEGIASYTATVLNAAKSFGKGLRELGEQVAAGLTGTSGSGSLSKNSSFDSSTGVEAKQPGIVTIMDMEQINKDYSPNSTTSSTGVIDNESIVAHFIAHSEAVVAMEFDNSGMLLLTADRRGHDFHVFRIQPHPVSASLSAVHHLYVLHRGDTSAKVQNIAFSLDSRWVAVSTLRGTTHVFPITPYGGPMGVRTHTSLHVVNKLSRFHRSAGLSADGRSNSPISHSESTTFMQSLQPYHNTTLPPFPRPTIVLALAQLRQPFALGSPPGSAGLAMHGKIGVSTGGTSSASQRQRHSSLSDDNGKPLSVCAIFAKSRSWLLEPPNVTREASHRIQRKAVDSLFVMAGHGALIQYDLDTKLASNIAKEKICDDTPIELEVEAKAQWNLGRRRDGSHELMPPLTNDNWLMKDRYSCLMLDSIHNFDDVEEKTESWVSQVEIITHAGPHRRLWMGPQCVFKTYNTPSGSNLNHVDVEAVEIGVTKPTPTAAAMRSHPLSMPATATARCSLPVLIESGSYSSIEQSPKLMDRFHHDHLDSDFAVSHGDSRLKEDLADAMRESPSVSEVHKITGRLASEVAPSDSVSFYDARADPDIGDDDSDFSPKAMCLYSSSSPAMTSESLATKSLWDLVPDVDSDKTKTTRLFSNPLKKQTEIPKISTASVEKVVNPLGTVTTVISGISTEVKKDILDEVVSQLAAEECIIHENCDESLFRPVVAIFCDDKDRKAEEEAARENKEFCKPPELIRNKLVVPVIAKEVDAELSKREKIEKSAKIKTQNLKKAKDLSMENKKSIGSDLTNESDKKQKQQKEKFDYKQTPTESPITKYNCMEGKNEKMNKDNDNVECNRADNVNNKVNDYETKKGVTSMSSLEEEVIEFKRMSPLSVVKNRRQPTLSDVKGLRKEQSIEDSPKNPCKGLKSNEAKKTDKKGNESKKLETERFKQTERNEELSLKYNFSSDHQEEKIKESAQCSILPKSLELAEISDSEDQHTKLSIASKSHVSIDTPLQEVNVTEIEGDIKSTNKSNNLLDKKDLSKNFEKAAKVGDKSDLKPERLADVTSKEKFESEEPSKIAQSCATHDLRKNTIPASLTPKAAPKQNEEHSESDSLYTVKVIDTTEAIQQNKQSKPKCTENKTLKDVSNKLSKHKNSDSKLTPVVVSSPKKTPTKEQKESKKSANTPQECDNIVVSVAVPTETLPITSKNYVTKDSVDGVGKNNKIPFEQEVSTVVYKEENEVCPLLEPKSKTNPGSQPPLVMNPVWKTLNTVQTAKTHPDTHIDNYPTLGAVGKTKKFVKNKESSTEKSEGAGCKSGTKCSSNFESFSALQPLESLPPLPVLEPLEMSPYTTILKHKESKPLTKVKDNLAEQLSLINFDSPLQEHPKSDRKMASTSTLSGINHQNLIFALCGSLHYEGDEDKLPTECPITSNPSGGDPTVTEYKLLHENEEQYLSLEQSSQETNTTNTATTNEKSSSSENSSASEEIIVIEEKKMSKKQRRKRQQMEIKQQQEEESVTRDDDEELRPLIGMTDSHLETLAGVRRDVPCSMPSKLENKDVPGKIKNITVLELAQNATASPLANSTTTTTDSEGPIPATTSDDNIFILPLTPANTHAPMKQKTKRIEHKINLMAAIDAATSSSTSSAEESNMETESRRIASDQELSVHGVGASQTQTVSTNVSLVTPSCAPKKKSKRRKR
ncbi:LOW QUALITY PROTEIN: uncharacterized protein LOC118750750 [Rhagoletis pomonella]|uniref:LOW QUALITY PROTEIN: uncharacterized protein LOC118750742 n=1 Tax=Rhagoletis pomonella TaxID=28610 RepID=UPI001783B516|nr:LOW QUALITY PROTEIN: uncharacterized protein LOC118750742 [Rhagoletis pomonella]XP_036341377.1 LOW QUALITY PROTEIN: uncharacterized protein LOC118750750 [Rhagoletis pomonella]